MMTHGGPTTLTLPFKLIYRWGYSIAVLWDWDNFVTTAGCVYFWEMPMHSVLHFFPLIILLEKWKPSFWDLQVHSWLGRVNLCLFFFFFVAAHGISVPQPGIEPGSPALEVWTMDHQESPYSVFLNGPFERSPLHCVLLSHKTTWYF